jgi:GT2 family glycosyltransferase
MTPPLSIVMVSHGALAWTERALAAVAAHTQADHEVIVVDNASPDGTPARLREAFPEVRLIENASNLGFGPASNQGAEAAAAPVLVFLNTDALVEPGWDGPLVQAVARQDVAAAVPCVLELDGRVQCAGALLARDGTVIEHGNGEDPADAAYRFPRAVDFGPGACLVVRREAFWAAGGFDPLYAPAYYEDADLCLALTARGGRTLFVPESRVRHAKKASGGLDLAQALSERHRSFFAERWHEALAGRPASLARPTPRRILAARDAGADGRILVTAAGETVLELLERRPWARVTLLTDSRTDAAQWLARGVEVTVPEDRARWLAERRFHYDAVVSEAPPPELRATHVPPLTGEPLRRALAGAGLV